MKKNDVLNLEITAVSSDGVGIGRHEGMAVFVPGSALGDMVEAVVIKVLKNYSIGKIINIITPSKDRADLSCKLFGACGGCAFCHISYEAECSLKKAFVSSNASRIGKLSAFVDELVPSPKPLGYRNKAIYPVRLGDDGKIVAGFFKKHSHKVISGSSCTIQPEIFGRIVDSVVEFMNENGISPYNEETLSGVVRNVYLRSAKENAEIMLCLVVNGDFKEKNEFSQYITSKYSEIKTVVLNFNNKNTNVVLGEREEVLFGKGYIEDTLLGLKFKISPKSFYQVNKEGAEKLYSIAYELLAPTENDLLLDLYCGTGTIGLGLAHRVKKLIGIEIVPSAIDDARENAERNGIRNAEFICADAGKGAEMLIERGEKPSAVIIDPPRKGCDLKTIEALCEIGSQKIVMISCDSATMARDCALLEERGYKAEKIVPVDMFPRTHHVESVVCLTRRLDVDMRR